MEHDTGVAIAVVSAAALVLVGSRRQAQGVLTLEELAEKLEVSIQGIRSLER